MIREKCYWSGLHNTHIYGNGAQRAKKMDTTHALIVAISDPRF